MMEKSLSDCLEVRWKARSKLLLSLVHRNTNVTLAIKTFKIQWKKGREWKSYLGQ